MDAARVETVWIPMPRGTAPGPRAWVRGVARGVRAEGTCAVVPFLHAPGFCKIQTDIPFLRPAGYPDASRFPFEASLVAHRAHSDLRRLLHVRRLRSLGITPSRS